MTSRPSPLPRVQETTIEVFPTLLNVMVCAWVAGCGVNVSTRLFPLADRQKVPSALSKAQRLSSSVKLEASVIPPTIRFHE